ITSSLPLSYPRVSPPLLPFPTRRSSDLFLAAYVVTRQALRPAPDFDDRLRSLKVEPPPGYSPTAAARALNQVIDLLLERRIDLRSEEHTSELQSRENLVCRLPLEK